MTIEQFDTERLAAERLVPEHGSDIAVLLGDPRVGETLGGVRTPEEATRRHAQNMAHWDVHGFGIWHWRDRATGAFVARAGLNHTIVGGRGEVEIGWAVVPERWGRGLGTEIAQASAAVAFGELGLDTVVAFTQPENSASRRVMEKAGFVFERDLVHAHLPHVLYRLRASDPGA